MRFPANPPRTLASGLVAKECDARILVTALHEDHCSRSGGFSSHDIAMPIVCFQGTHGDRAI